MKGRYLVGLLLLLACAPSNGKTNVEQRTRTSAADSLVLERSVCYGTCPAYRLRLSDDGAVRFESRNPGDNGRIIEDTAAATTLSSLVSKARSIGFFELPAEIAADSILCRFRATDNPTVVITVFARDDVKHVQDYWGCVETVEHGIGPRVARLRLFEAEIDSVLQSSRWVRPATRR